MSLRFFTYRLGLAAVVASAVLSGAIPAQASVRNGELCSVQTWDHTIRASIYTWTPDVPADRATRQQLEQAGGWCTRQVQTTGWIAADKYYDSWEGQMTVCLIDRPGALTAIGVFSDPGTNDVSYGVQVCNDIATNPLDIRWFPDSNQTSGTGYRS
jgi:hypothetical protein